MNRFHDTNCILLYMYAVKINSLNLDSAKPTTNSKYIRNPLEIYNVVVSDFFFYIKSYVLAA